MTAVESPPTSEALVSQPESSVLFMARRRSLRLVKESILPRYGAAGQKVGEQPGQTVVFRDGTLRVPLEGEMVLEDGRKCDAVEVLEWLEKHPRLKDLNEGFWRVDPTAPPVTGEEMRAIMEAAIELDEDKLVALVEQERAGWDREAVLSTAEDALTRIRTMKQAAAEQAAVEAKAAAEAAVAEKAAAKKAAAAKAEPQE